MNSSPYQSTPTRPALAYPGAPNLSHCWHANDYWPPNPDPAISVTHAATIDDVIALRAPSRTSTPDLAVTCFPTPPPPAASQHGRTA